MDRSWTLEQIRCAAFPPLVGYLNRNILTEGTVSLMTGAPGIGKSFLALKLSDCIATGSNFAYMPTREGRVLFDSEEMTVREMQPRILDFRMASNNGHLLFRFQQDIKINFDIGKVQRMVETEEADVLILDTFSDCHCAPESSNDVMKMIISKLRDKVARQFNCSILLIHHSGKDYGNGTGANDSRGAIAIEAGCSDIMVCKRLEDGQRYIHFKKVRHGPEPEDLNYSLTTGEDGKTDVTFSID